MNQKKGKGRPNYVCYTSCLWAVIAMTEMLKAAAHENIRIGKGKNTGLIILLGHNTWSQSMIESELRKDIDIFTENH